MANNCFWSLIALAFFALLLGGAFAFETNFPAHVDVFQSATNSPTNVVFIVNNTTSGDIDFTSEVFIPSNYYFSGLPTVLKANSENEIYLVIFPKKELEGSSYNGKIVFYAGDETVSKNFTVNYKALDVPVSPPNPPNNGDSNSGTDSNSTSGIFSGFVSFFASNLEFAVIVALVIIAAILLIAFIARFVKRISK